VGVEALIRWRHPDLGLLAPGHFMPVLEQTGLIYSVGEWVLRESTRQLRDWMVAGLPNTRITVNLSALQFRQPKLLESLRRAVADAELQPGDVELEITETALLDGGPDGVRMLQTLRQHGFRIALDDFGTGYSSLGYLRRFPVDRLKIDRTFIRDAEANSDDAAIVVTILELARALGIDAVAEGVESKEQCAFLRANGCTEMQGHMFGRPMPADDLAERLAANARFSPTKTE